MLLVNLLRSESLVCLMGSGKYVTVIETGEEFEIFQYENSGCSISIPFRVTSYCYVCF